MSQDAVVWTLRLLFAGLALGAVALFVVIPMVRLLRQKPDISLLTPDFASQLEEEELEIPTDCQPGMPDRQELVRQLKKDPRQAALMIQSWLKQRK